MSLSCPSFVRISRWPRPKPKDVEQTLASVPTSLFPLLTSLLRQKMHCQRWSWDVGEHQHLHRRQNQCRNDANQTCDAMAHHPRVQIQALLPTGPRGKGSHPCQVPSPLDWSMSPYINSHAEMVNSLLTPYQARSPAASAGSARYSKRKQREKTGPLVPAVG